MLQVNVTAHPYAAWAAQQIVEAIGPDIVPLRLIRDRDAIFGSEFDARVDNLGVRQIRISPITTRTDRTCRSIAMRQSSVPFNRTTGHSR